MFVIVLIILINITIFVVVGFVLLSSIYLLVQAHGICSSKLCQPFRDNCYQSNLHSADFGKPIWKIRHPSFGKEFFAVDVPGQRLRSLPSRGYCGGDCTKEDFDRRRAVELKHGRICMFATIGDLDAVCWKW
jgi:hypothetical protein